MTDLARAEAAEAALLTLQRQVRALVWVLERAEYLVGYDHGKVAAYAFTQAWGELPPDLPAETGAPK